MLKITKEKLKASRSRTLPLLPRLGLVFDFMGKRYTLRSVPLAERIHNLLSRGLKLADLEKVTAEQFSEIEFPPEPKFKHTLDVKAQHLDSKDKSPGKRPLKRNYFRS